MSVLVPTELEAGVGRAAVTWNSLGLRVSFGTTGVGNLVLPGALPVAIVRGDLQWSECWDLDDLGSLRGEGSRCHKNQDH